MPVKSLNSRLPLDVRCMAACLAVALVCLIAVSCNRSADSVSETSNPKNDAIPGSLGSASAAETPTLTIGSMAPAIDIEHWLSNGNGKFRPVTEFEDGKVYLVDFWATWSGPCVASMPHLAEIQAKYADQDVQLISISNENLATINEFLNQEIAKTKQTSTDSDGDDSDESAEEDSESVKTYRDLTSAYCLTTDEDRSVYKDYMHAAKQNEIPICFIVGKTGLIEWIGNPMRMDEPLSDVVNDAWNMEAQMVAFKKSQERQAFMSSVMQKMRSGDSEAAMLLIEEGRAIAEGDSGMIESLNAMSFRITMSPVMRKAREGNYKESLQLLEKMEADVASEHKPQLATLKFQLLMGLDDIKSAVKLVKEEEPIDAQVLNSAAWEIYKEAKYDPDYPKEKISHAIIFAEKAVADDPNSGAILDTLAHLYYLQGDLDRAIELQTQALENSGSMKARIEPFLNSLKVEKEKAATERT